ncbi:hypothetical protein GNI_173890 [Gregarina niphandrodes]|uniref:Transmembrane protein n=1 Tax=Gregarina niphandrodes TaxID=110365 RepID=A0A023AXM9_GRENI|nr:hypothetical protein GNI_173890 [Gregarina niphandrodes]EZG43396.1 hypothetical protein GNI_173890 [Gregarina niphandrodes]|eukprot:XP_011133373.1 hypothetical protein GNI_173890 [Gregarina niphandrodes]
MRGCEGSSAKTVSVTVALALLAAAAEGCRTLESGGVFAHLPCRDGVPSLPADSFRLDWGGEHLVTSMVYLSIALQCLELLDKDKSLILASVDQIYFRQRCPKITVHIDPRWRDYTRREAEGSRVFMAHQVLCRLATYTGHKTRSELPSYREGAYPLWRDFAAQLFDHTPSQTWAVPDSLKQMHEQFAQAYLAADPSFAYHQLNWRNACRPWLGRKHRQIAVLPTKGSSRTCVDCRPQVLTDLDVPLRLEKLKVESSSSIHNVDSRNWIRVAALGAKEIRRQAHDRGLTTGWIGLSKTWRTMSGSSLSDSDTERAIQQRLYSGYLIKLYDLLRVYRLAPKLFDDLQKQIRSLLKRADNHSLFHKSDNWCVGSYDQVYVSLECRTPDIDSPTKLHIVLNPECMKAKSKKQAQLVTDSFLNLVKLHAGCAYYPSSSRWYTGM